MERNKYVMQKKEKISLGFTPQQFEPGIHICQIFNSDEERHDSLVNFIISGLNAGEKTTCFSDNESEQTLTDLFQSEGFNFVDLTNKGDFSISGTKVAYFENNKFEPERMLNLLKDFYKNSEQEKHNGARVIGEMTPDIEHIDGGSRLLEYESKITLLLREYPINAVCQYDARAFDGSTILDVLKVHPYMIVRGKVVHNPFFEQPEDFLAKHNCC